MLDCLVYFGFACKYDVWCCGSTKVSELSFTVLDTVHISNDNALSVGLLQCNTELSSTGMDEPRDEAL